MEETLPVNARELGLNATVASLQELLVKQFQIATTPDAIRTDEPIFSAGVGLSSLEGMELLAALEKKYRVPFDDLEFWIDESPTLDDVAQYLIKNSPVNESDSSPADEL